MDGDEDHAANRVVGGVLRELREQANLSLPQAARLVGLSFGAIGMYERGERAVPLFRLVDLAAAYGRDPRVVLLLLQQRVSVASSI